MAGQTDISRRPAPDRAAVRSRRADGRAGSRATTFRIRLTTRGALLGLGALDLVTFLLAAWLHAGVLAGLGFCAGGILAPSYLRREAQLQVAAAVPAVALVAVILTQAVTAGGSSGHRSALSVVEGTFLTLAALAPWLFAGTAACLSVACFRGLPKCIGDLRASLRPEASSGQSSAGRHGSYRSPAS